MHAPAPAWRIGVLAWVAGDIDTFGYLSLGHVFITHMTGNTGVLAIALAKRDYVQALQSGLVIPVFFLGALCGAAIVDSAARPRQVMRALAIEAILLLVYAAGVLSGYGAPAPLSPGHSVMLLVLAGSMGLQNAALAHPGTRGTHTTHLTGPLTDLATEVVRFVMPSRRAEFDPLQTARFAVRLIGFLTGGICGATLFLTAPPVAPLLAALVLIGIVLVQREWRPTRQAF